MIGYPRPGGGIGILTTGAPWFGNYVPVFSGTGYAYGDVGPGIIQLVPDPTCAHPFGGFGNCSSPPDRWDAVLGGIGINMEGTYVEPVAASPVGATDWGQIKAIYR
jgi:hypothetical protein